MRKVLSDDSSTMIKKDRSNQMRIKKIKCVFRSIIGDRKKDAMRKLFIAIKPLTQKS